jgi:hypothetical protein
VLGAFNLLPAYPLDGGRILRAVVGAYTSHARATRIAAGIGALLAAGLAAVGLLSRDVVLLLIALFVFLAGRQEAAVATTRELLKGLPARAAMATRLVSLASFQPLDDAVAALLLSKACSTASPRSRPGRCPSSRMAASSGS